MPPRYWMISDRNVDGTNLGRDRDALTFWTSEGGTLDDLRSWRRVRDEQFRRLLVAAADRFPAIKDPARQHEQRHVTVFIHGYNSDWKDAARLYRRVCAQLFEGAEGLGLCILFSWPSDGMKFGYYPDRMDARSCAPDLAEILGRLYDWMVEKQRETADRPGKGCYVKTSVIAHSMGNYVLQKAMQLVWTRKNQPLLVSLLSQLLMVAADIDNDLFHGGEAIDRSDGDAIANLAYRVTAFFTGRDPVLGLSAGLKHFGKRRLGRSGLDGPVSDNVWDVDCSTLISPDARNIHSAYFDEPKTTTLMREVLRGIDRHVLTARGIAPAEVVAVG